MGWIFLVLVFMVGISVGYWVARRYDNGRHIGNLICDVSKDDIFRLELHASLEDVYKCDKVTMTVIRK